MQTAPVQPKIYHITHVGNLESIIGDGGILCDVAMAARGGPVKSIGMSEIKKGRLALPVKCHPGDRVGDYVPFYFCPRSVMLYVIHMANHPGLSYRGGQGPIVHLESDLHDVVAWASASNRRWAFSLSNAGGAYAQFRASLAYLHEVDWAAVAALDWQAASIKEGKQAEFLVRELFSWQFVARIGVRNIETQERVIAALDAADHRPPVEVRPDWYY